MDLVALSQRPGGLRGSSVYDERIEECQERIDEMSLRVGEVNFEQPTFISVAKTCLATRSAAMTYAGLWHLYGECSQALTDSLMTGLKLVKDALTRAQKHDVLIKHVDLLDKYGKSVAVRQELASLLNKENFSKFAEAVAEKTGAATEPASNHYFAVVLKIFDICLDLFELEAVEDDGPYSISGKSFANAGHFFTKGWDVQIKEAAAKLEGDFRQRLNWIKSDFESIIVEFERIGENQDEKEATKAFDQIKDSIAKLRHRVHSELRAAVYLNSTLLGEYAGVVESIEEETAYVRLTSSNGDVLHSPLSLQEISNAKLVEKQRFHYKVIQGPGMQPHAEVKSIPLEHISGEEDDRERERIESVIKRAIGGSNGGAT